MRNLFSKTLLALVLLAGVAAGALQVQAQDIQVIHPTNTLWTYNDSSISTDNPTIAPGTSWRDPAYVPVIGSGVNQWKTGGRGLFGNDTSTVYTNLFGTLGNGFRTPLNRDIPGVGTSARITFYFITKFDWPFPPANVILRGTNWLDDGGVVYLNGVEVFRQRIGTPGIVPGWGDFAANQGAEGVPEPLEYAASSLVMGENTLAVEVHQGSATSSDLAFTTALRAVLPAPPTNTTPNEPSDRTVLQNRSTTMTIVGDGSPRPTYQWCKDNVPIPGATSPSYTIPLMQSSDAGLYKVILNNEFGSATSRVATVSYEPDMVPPRVTLAVGSATFTNVVVEFDHLMDKESVEDPFNWIIAGLTVTSPTLNADGKSVTLMTDPQVEGALYTVTVTGVKDLALNDIGTDNTADFRAWVTTGCSGLLFEAYAGFGGNAVADLTSHPSFPNSPTEVLQMTRFDTREVYPNDGHEAYGARVRGLFIPPLSGNYIFYLRSDDAGALYFNPTGPSAAGRVLIALENGCCNAFLPPGAPQTSLPQPLIAGQAYYIEALYKEGTGGDYLNVAARLQAAGVPPTSESIPAGQVGYPAVPPNVVGGVNITQQPASQSVPENTPSVTFSVAANNAQGAAICYQWQRSDNNGPFADLPGANKSSYSLTYPTIANDNGDKYRCIVLVPGASATSAEALLTITADVTRPTVVCVLATSPTSLVVYFSEPPDANSADPFNFGVDQGISVANAVQNANLLRMDLTLDGGTPMTLGTAYNVSVFGPATAPGGGGVLDRAGNPIAPDPSVHRVVAQNYPGNPDGLRTLPADNCLPIGCLTDRGFNCRMYQVATAIANDNATAELILTGASGPNIAPLPTFMETGVINYNKDIPGADVGHILGDLQFPGYPPNPTATVVGYENMVMEALCYVELKAGIHRWIVNSDDGFRVYAGLTPSGAIIGEFNGGRGSADTVFEFIVKEDCLYPFRLMWEQGQGGANVEWEKEDLNNPGTYVAINGNDSIKAYKLPVYRVAISLTATGTVVITWSPCTAVLQCADEVTGPWVDVGGATSPYVIPAAAARAFYRVSNQPQAAPAFDLPEFSQIPDGATEVADLPLSPIPGSLDDQTAAQARTAAEANPQVRSLLGDHYAFISVTEVLPPKGTDPAPGGPLQTLATFYSYTHNWAVRVAMSDMVAVTITNETGFQSHEGQSEIDEAIAAARQDPRIRDQVQNLIGSGLLELVEDPVASGYGHRVIYTGFVTNGGGDGLGAEAPLYYARYDLNDRVVLGAGPVDEPPGGGGGNAAAFLCPGPPVFFPLVFPCLGNPAQSGLVNWTAANGNNWQFTWHANTDCGLAIRNVRYNGRYYIYKADLPVVKVKYTPNVVGPYNDILAWGNMLCITPTQKVRQQTFWWAGHQYLQIWVYCKIGQYRLIQAYYFRDDGWLLPRLGSKGLQACRNHVHAPHWQIDYDIQGLPNQAPWLNDRTWRWAPGWQLLPFEVDGFQPPGLPLLGQDCVSGRRVWAYGCQTGPPDPCVPRDFALRRWHPGEGCPWPFPQNGPVCIFPPVPWNNLENVNCQDNVLWEIGHLYHSVNALDCFCAKIGFPGDFQWTGPCLWLD